VAAKAGVSAATVSYVLNERNTSVRISDNTRQRVLEAASHLGYRRNELARAVITGKNRMLGFWVMQSNREPVVRVLGGRDEGSR
jgi:LacI family transcriptional regulator